MAYISLCLFTFRMIFLMLVSSARENETGTDVEKWEDSTHQVSWWGAFFRVPDGRRFRGSAEPIIGSAEKRCTSVVRLNPKEAKVKARFQLQSFTLLTELPRLQSDKKSIIENHHLFLLNISFLFKENQSQKNEDLFQMNNKRFFHSIQVSFSGWLTSD